MVRGLDHLVVAVKDLEAAGQAWSDLGFTVTPENRHSWGTANRLVQLDGFFVELLSVADPELIFEASDDVFSFGAFNRDFLGDREGASMLVLDSVDPQKDRADFRKAGMRLYEPFSFERTANLSDGSKVQVAFDLTFTSDPLAPEIGFFTCHNRFPENFWKEAFQDHANGADNVKAVYFVAGDPSDHHEFLGGLTGQREMRASSLGLALKTTRGVISVLTPSAYASLVGAEASEQVSGPLPQIAALEIGCKRLAERKIIPASQLFGLTLILTPEVT
ncbi:VOC family protein [Roseibium sp. LAB1]